MLLTLYCSSEEKSIGHVVSRLLKGPSASRGGKGFTFPKVGLSLPYLSVEKLEYLVVQDTVPAIMAGAGYLIGAELIPRFVKVSQWAQ